MNTLNIPASKTTPEVLFDIALQKFSISGNSTPVDALEFYNSLMDWVTNNKSNIPAEAEFSFNLPYFNSSSHKGIYLLLKHLQDTLTDGVKIIWQVFPEDEFMLEAGETMQELIDLQFDFVEVEEKE